MHCSGSGEGGKEKRRGEDGETEAKIRSENSGESEEKMQDERGEKAGDVKVNVYKKWRRRKVQEGEESEGEEGR